MLYASPWTNVVIHNDDYDHEFNYNNLYVRRKIPNKFIKLSCGAINKDGDNYFWRAIHWMDENLEVLAQSEGKCLSLEEAMENCDNVLIYYGYKLSPKNLELFT